MSFDKIFDLTADEVYFNLNILGTTLLLYGRIFDLPRNGIRDAILSGGKKYYYHHYYYFCFYFYYYYYYYQWGAGGGERGLD